VQQFGRGLGSGSGSGRLTAGGSTTLQTDFEVPYLAKATIAQQAAIVVGLSGNLSKPAKNEAWCHWRRKLGAADSGKESAAEDANPVGYLSGDTGIGLATFSYRLSMTRCLRTQRRLTIICLIGPATAP
jgi:hypothetical protein